jgi:hypothetical protein
MVCLHLRGLLLHAAAGLCAIAASVSTLLAMRHRVLAALHRAGLAHLHAQRANRVAVGVAARNGGCRKSANVGAFKV